jgi:hypothetical protein
MVENPRSFVLSEWRTGKTRAALWAADFLLEQHPEWKCLVVSDLKAIQDTWAQEITGHFLGKRSYELLLGPAAKRLELLNRPADFYLVNHDGLRVMSSSLLQKRFAIILFDETTYKSHSGLTYKAAKDLSRWAQHVHVLTAEPTSKSPLDAYCVKTLCQPDCGLTYTRWKNQTTCQDGYFPGQRKPLAGAEQMVADLLSPSIRITQEQVFTPTKLNSWYLKAELSDEQRRYMRELRKELLINIDGGKIDAVNMAALRTKLIQISCGVVYDTDHIHHRIDASPRCDLLKKLIKGISGRKIVFTPFISTNKLLYDEISGSIVYEGTRENKDKAMNDWKYSEGCVLLSHPSPIARGIDLAVCNVIIWYGPVDRTEFFTQACERINGINQTKPRYVIRMYGCSIEKEIYDRLDANMDMHGVIMKLKEMEL